MLDTVVNMFTRKDSHRNAVLGLARIISRYDLANISYSAGLIENRRAKDEHHASWGVWLFPCEENDRAKHLKISSSVPAVTHDLRGEGLGIMTPIPFKGDYVVVALPDEEDGSWRFFKGEIRHNTRRPGGWYHLGIQVDITISLEQSQLVEFRKHIQVIESASAD